MTEALAVEWARFGINVNGIAPGAFSSEMMDGMLERIGDITQTPSPQAHRRPGAARQHACCTSWRRRRSSSPAPSLKVDDGQGSR